jgi:hypothetical protein
MIVGSAAISSATVPLAILHLEQAIEIARTTELPRPVAAYDIDALTVAHSTHSLALVLAGRAEEARREIERAVRRARELDHVNTMSTALLLSANVAYFMDDPESARRGAEECLEVVRDRDFHTNECESLILSGWARACLGDLTGIATIEEGIERTESTGSMGALVQCYLTAADAHLLARDLDRASTMVDRAAAAIERTRERTAYEPQIPMYRAEILLASEAPPLEVLDRLLDESTRGWHAYQSPWMELRTALLRGQLARRSGYAADARDHLISLCDRMPDAADTRRVHDARALLASLD